jgi:hypothetical protein
MPTTTKHTPAVREALRRANRSMATELDADEVNRARSKRAAEMSGERLWRYITGQEEANGQRPAYDDEVRRTAKIVRELCEGKGAPGAKQIEAVRKAIGRTDPVEASGMSGRALRRYAAEGRTPEGDRMRPTPEMAAISERCGGDPFCRARKLAVILAGLDAARKSGPAG